MKTVGEILSSERKKKGVGIVAVAKATKIRPFFIKAIEKNDFTKLSSSTAYGFIKNYARFLGVSSKFVLAVFRRDFRKDQRGRIIPRGLVKPLDAPKIFRSPRIGLFLITTLFIIGILAYLSYQYFFLVRGPSLEITIPEEQVKTALSFIEIVGKTDSDAAVSVGGELINISPKGEFRSRVDLIDGKNIIVIEATNRLGRTRRVIREVLKE